jgi:acyl carrier protein
LPDGAAGMMQRTHRAALFLQVPRHDPGPSARCSPIANQPEAMMSSVREKLNEIIAEFAGAKPEDVAAAHSLSEIQVDSITMLGIVDEIEEFFGIKIDVAGDFNFDMSMADFEKLISDLVAKKNA